MYEMVGTTETETDHEKTISETPPKSQILAG